MGIQNILKGSRAGIFKLVSYYLRETKSSGPAHIFMSEASGDLSGLSKSVRAFLSLF